MSGNVLINSTSRPGNFHLSVPNSLLSFIIDFLVVTSLLITKCLISSIVKSFPQSSPSTIKGNSVVASNCQNQFCISTLLIGVKLRDLIVLFLVSKIPLMPSNLIDANQSVLFSPNRSSQSMSSPDLLLGFNCGLKYSICVFIVCSFYVCI